MSRTLVRILAAAAVAALAPAAHAANLALNRPVVASSVVVFAARRRPA